VKINYAYDLANLQPADANPVEANFSKTELHINQELIERDGTVAMRQQLKLAGDPVAPLDAAPKQYVDLVLPIGIILPFGSNVVPIGGKWLLCDGTEYQTADYPELFAVIGNNFVTGTPSAGHFNVPQMMDQRFMMGSSSVGSKGGNADAAVAEHTHPIDHDHPNVASSNEYSWHQHAGVDHLHRVDIWSGGQNQTHVHAMRGTEVIAQDGGSFGRFRVADWQTTPYPVFGNTLEASQDHQHAINGWSGAADRALTTGSQNAFHAHYVDLPAYAGASGSSGVAAANANLPPYLGVAFVIRAH